MTDDYWGPMPDDSEYPTPRERLDDGEADRLRALLRRWVEGTSWQRASGDSRLRMPVTGYRCLPCGEWATSVAAISHAPGCIVGDTLKELGE